MLRETGVISAIDRDTAVVQTRSKLACSSCKLTDNCGNGIIEKYFSGSVFSSTIQNDLNAQIGDWVTIEIPRSSVTKASLIVYALPLLPMFFAMIIANYLDLQENELIFFSLAGLLIGLGVTKYYNQNFVSNELYSPRMVSINNSSPKRNLKINTSSAEEPAIKIKLT
jgi:sigma-E factor negative regulatory protein RseC